MWLPLYFLDDAALDLGKASFRAFSWWPPGKAALEFLLNSMQPQLLKSVCFPDGPWVLEPTQGGLTHSFPIPQSHMASQEAVPATGPVSPGQRSQQSLSSALQPQLPGWLEPQSSWALAFSRQQTPGLWLSLPQALSQHQGVFSEESEGQRKAQVRLRSTFPGARAQVTKPGSASCPATQAHPLFSAPQFPRL